jgi:DNA polymerase-3 subunit alpha
VVIGDRPLAELVPLYRDPRSDMPVTQFDMKYVEGAGLVKFDFLGLKTLSVLKKAQQLLAKRGIAVDLDALTWDDPASMRCSSAATRWACSSWNRRGCAARSRPSGPPTSATSSRSCRSIGPARWTTSRASAPQAGSGADRLSTPLLEGILAETYGIFVYQEQVMQAAQVLAGYSLGGADLLRRAMGKKIKAEMDAQRATFVEGCASANGIPADKANELFDLIDKFAGYGFNKSHAAAYALLAYQTAWLKAHHPHDFYAASMCYDMALTDKLGVFVDDARRAGVMVLPPT